MATLQPEFRKLKKQLEKVIEGIGGTISVEERAAATRRTYRRKWIEETTDKKTKKKRDEQFYIDWHTSYSAPSSVNAVTAHIKRGLEKLGLDRKEIRKKMLNRLIAGDEANIVIFNEINARTRELAQLHRMLDRLEDME
jgi:hypothetical protein